MKCPLFTAAEMSHEPEFKPAQNDCLKEECAWWRDDIQMCAMKDISLEVGYLQHRFADMVDKMPPAREF